jgi:hypothetical protein
VRFVTGVAEMTELIQNMIELPIVLLENNEKIDLKVAVDMDPKYGVTIIHIIGSDGTVPPLDSYGRFVETKSTLSMNASKHEELYKKLLSTPQHRSFFWLYLSEKRTIFWPIMRSPRGAIFKPHPELCENMLFMAIEVIHPYLREQLDKLLAHYDSLTPEERIAQYIKKKEVKIVEQPLLMRSSEITEPKPNSKKQKQLQDKKDREYNRRVTKNQLPLRLNVASKTVLQEDSTVVFKKIAVFDTDLSKNDVLEKREIVITTKVSEVSKKKKEREKLLKKQLQEAKYKKRKVLTPEEEDAQSRIASSSSSLCLK